MNEPDSLKAALRHDLLELGQCTLTCALHGAVALIILLLISVSWDAAASTAMLLGGVKLFQVADDRSYLHQTKTHLRQRRR